jgi:hypothetical protein
MDGTGPRSGSYPIRPHEAAEAGVGGTSGGGLQGLVLNGKVAY